MSDSPHYVIRGGLEGRERLRVLARVMHASTAALLDRVGLRDGLVCLDAGCGGGDVTVELARRVAPHGRALGIDIDEAKLDVARREAQEHGVANATFERLDVGELAAASLFDVIYTRFLLTHLSDPAGTVRTLYRHLQPGGMIAVEDIDFKGAFTYPESSAYQRYDELYCATVRRRGGDPHIGPRLPSLLQAAGFEQVGVAVVQPVGVEGEAKLLNPLTMERIADAVLADGLATVDEIDEIVRALYEFAADPATVAGLPRVVQAWGRVP